MMKLAALMLSLVLLLHGCQECYPGGYSSLTDYPVGDYVETPDGIRVYNEYAQVDLAEIDMKVRELEACLGVVIRRRCFAVLIPADWFTSVCSGEQMLPVVAPWQQCADKGLYLPEQCQGLPRPIAQCPCVCTYRVALQANFYIVVPPNLKLFKVDLARLVTNINNPWQDPKVALCVGS